MSWRLGSKRVMGAAVLMAWCGAWVLQSPSAVAAPIHQAMQQSTVRLLCVNPKQGKATSSGSGFVVGDGGFVVTNWHVAGCTSKGESLFLVLSLPIRSEADRIPAEVEWHSEDMDLALLKLERNSRKPPVGFASKDTVEVMDEVTVSGFPGAADDEQLTAMSDWTTVSLTKGVISRVVRKQPDLGLYQVDASINPGNSGGPLFDRNGKVIGINTYASLTLVPQIQGAQKDGSLVVGSDRVHSAEGIGWAVQADYLFPVFEQFGIPYKQHAPKSSWLDGFGSSNPVVLVSVGFATLISLSAIAMALIQRGRRSPQQVAIQSKRLVSRSTPPPPQPSPAVKPMLRGVQGHFAGARLDLSQGPLLIGRDPQTCQLVLPASSEFVSKQHCILRYDQGTGRITLEDRASANGTFVNGQKIPQGLPVRLASGDRFYVGSPAEQFEVDLH